MLEALRGKRMLFVGDSLNRGQYVSFICLIHSVIPENAKSMETIDSLTIFKAKVIKLHHYGLASNQYALVYLGDYFLEVFSLSIY